MSARAFGPRRRAGIVAALLLVSAAGCAHREPPNGGPLDSKPPKLLASSPDSGTAGVALNPKFALTFSEAMEPRTTQDAVQISPPVPFKSRRWSRHTLTLDLEQPLLPDHAYTLFVGTSARDRHGNNMASGATIVFSTATSFPRGRIEGVVDSKGFDATGTFLWCYEASRRNVPDSTGRDFDALGQVDEADHFRIDGLKVPGEYRIWAFADLDMNRSFDPMRDILAKVDTTISLTDAAPVAGPIRLRLLNPRAMSSIAGTVIDSLRDSLGVIRIEAASEADTTIVGLADVDKDGKFELNLRPGVWLVRAFQDEDKSKDWNPRREPASAPLRIELAPADHKTDVHLVLGPPR